MTSSIGQTFFNALSSRPAAISYTVGWLASIGTTIFLTAKTKTAYVFIRCCEHFLSPTQVIDCSRVFHYNTTERQQWCASHQNLEGSFSRYASLLIPTIFLSLGLGAVALATW